VQGIGETGYPFDYLNLLLLTKGHNTIDSYYFDANGEACIQPNALRIHGKFMESTDWDDVKQRFAITDRQVLELKSVAYEFKRTTCDTRIQSCERSAM
jgi:hypothetical protein